MAEFDFASFVDEWALDKKVADILTSEKFTTKASLLGLSEDDIVAMGMKRGDQAALRTAVTRLQAGGGGGPLAPKAAPLQPPGAVKTEPSVLLNELL